MENNREGKGKQIRVQFGFKGVEFNINGYDASEVQIISKALSGGIFVWLFVAFTIIAVAYLGLDFLGDIPILSTD